MFKTMCLLALTLACSQHESLHLGSSDSGTSGTGGTSGAGGTSGTSGTSGAPGADANLLGPLGDASLAPIKVDANTDDAVAALRDDGPLEREVGPRIYSPPPDGGGPGTTGGMDDVPGGCSFAAHWFFPDERGASYCGLVGDACMWVCGTPIGCVVESPHGEGQQVYCPQDTRDAGFLPHH